LFWRKLLNIDSKIIYVVVGLALLLPVIKPVGMPVSISEEYTRRFYNYLTDIPKDAVVFFDLSFRETGEAELGSSVLPAFELLQKRGVKIVCGGQWQQAPFFMQSRLEKKAEEIGSVYGVDWVNIGYKPGGTATWRAMMEDFWKGAAGVDCNETKFDELPLMDRVRKLDKETFAAIVIWQAGTPGSGTWMQYAPDIPLLAVYMGGIGGNARYLRSGQVQAMIGGMQQAAEFEIITDCLGDATGLLDAQSLAVLVVIAFIVLGNISWIMVKRQDSLERSS